MQRREFLRQLAWSAPAAALAGSALSSACADRGTGVGARAGPSAGPNLIFIMADDLGYADTSLYGRSDYSTPVLDGLAREGVRLTQAYSSAPVCSPTRVALMTGRYPARTEAGLHEPLTTQPTGLAAQPPTLPRQLKAAGYQTALVGKWHLGLAADYHPLRHGFDEFFGHLGAAVDYVSHIGTEHLEHDLFDGDRQVHMDGYATDLFTERAVEWIQRPRSAPFFLSLQYNAPHWPWQAPGDPAYPDSLRWSRGGSPETYAAMMKNLDEGVGRVLDALRNAGRERDTLLIFTSDNGGERFSSMGPYRARKMTLWEGGIRVAAFARWPGVIAPDTVSTQVTTTMDWTATLLAAAGASTAAMAALDGIDVLPQLKGAAPIERDLYWRTFQRTRHKALRSGNLKYLETEDGEHLFDLAADPGELSDLRTERAADFERLKSAYAQWAAQMLAPIPLDPRYA
jgi:arylsulfatase A-like enzyme